MVIINTIRNRVEPVNSSFNNPFLKITIILQYKRLELTRERGELIET